MKRFAKIFALISGAGLAALLVVPEVFPCHGLLSYRFLPIEQARIAFAKAQAEVLKEIASRPKLDFPMPAVERWVKYYQNPVFKPGPDDSWEEFSVDCFTVGYYQNHYWMWYCGTPKSLNCQIGLATSPDGIHWTRNPENPVLRLGTGDSFDNSILICEHVLFDKEENIFKMWYVGGNKLGHLGIGYATSPDGVHWAKFAGNPVMRATEPWEGTLIEGQTVLKMKGEYKMWYGGIDIATDVSTLNYASSLDGIHWTKYVGNPIITPAVGTPRPWDGYSVDTPDIQYDGGTYHMYYRGWRQRNGVSWIGHATSTDGVHFTRDPLNPVLLTSTVPGAWDTLQIYRARVFWADGIDDKPLEAVDRMWFTGRDYTLKSQVGLAFSPRADLTGQRPPGRRIPMAVNQDSMNLIVEKAPAGGSRISYFTPWLDNIKLRIFDAAGKAVRTLVREPKLPGFYEIAWNGRDDKGRALKPGIYYAELAASKSILTGEIVLAR